MRRVTFSSERDFGQHNMASDKNSVSGDNAGDSVDISMISVQENKEGDHQKVEEWLGEYYIYFFKALQFLVYGIHVKCCM